MYHPSIWHPIDMTTTFRSMHPTTSSPNSTPEKKSVSFSVNTLLSQSSRPQQQQQQQHLFSSLFQHYPYTATFRPLFNGTTESSSAFLPANKRFKTNSHDENHCETTSSGDESSGKYSDHRCRSSKIDLQNPQCPICQISLNGQDMITHVQHELDTIQRKNKTKHKILQDTNTNQTFQTRYETFLRVRTSRQQRLNAKLQIHNRRSIRFDTRNCPICYQSLPTNSNDEYFFTHIQQCSRKREQYAAVSALANHQRFPAPPPPVSSTDDPDVNVVDIDDDGTEQESFNSDHTYSPSDYTKSSNIEPAKYVVCM